MAAITVNERQELTAIFLTMSGAGPSVLKLAHMVTAFEGGKSAAQLATELAAEPGFAAVAARNPSSFASWLADALLATDVPAAARSWALNWVVTQLDTKSRAQIVAEAVQAIRATTNGNYASSQAELAADVDAALLGLGNNLPIDIVYSLTAAGTDVLKGALSNETFTGALGQIITLQASDEVDGGAGNDVFRIVSDGAMPQSVGGFTVKNVETLEVQSQAVGGTTLGLENVTGLTTIRTTAGSSALMLNNVQQLTTLELRNGLGGQTITLNYKAQAIAGARDTQNLVVSGSTVDTLTIDGIEALAITTSTGDSILKNIVSNELTSVTVAGYKALSFTAALPASVTTVDASKQTGGGITLIAAAVDLAVKGGAGKDTVTYTGSLTTGDFFDGGAGRDTIIANVSEFMAADYSVASRIKNVEVIHFANVLTSNFDASLFTGEDSYVLGAGFLVPVTISKVSDGSTIDVRGSSFGTLTVSVGEGASLATVPGTNNTLHLALGAVFGLDVDTIDVSGVENLSIASNGNINDVGSGNVATLIDQALTTLTLTGIEDLKLTISGNSLTTLDASGSSGANDFSRVTYKSGAGAAITGGAGADKITGSTGGDTIAGGAGNDVIAGAGGADILTGGAGRDTFYFNDASDSSGSSKDTITDFVSGSDLINVQDIATRAGRFEIVVRNGAAPNFVAAQAALTANSGATQVVLQADDNTLWVDVNDDGQLTSSDLAVKLTGVTKLVASDFGGTVRPDGFGNLVTIIGNGAVVNATTATNASLSTTTSHDTIWASIAHLNSLSALDGLAGTDTLKITDAGVVTIPSAVSNVETIELATVGTTANTVNINASSVSSLVGSANADTVNSANMVAATGASITLGAGADTLNLSVSLPGTAIDLGADDDVVNIAAGVVVASVLSGGTGIDTLNVTTGVNVAAASISGFERFDASSTSSNFTLATTQGFTRMKFGSGNDTLTSVVANTVTVIIEFGAGNDTVSTLQTGTGDLTLDFGSGDATIATIAAHGSGKLTLKIADMPGLATAVSIAATEANFVAGDLIDFASAATAIVNAKADGTQGTVGGVGQVFFDTATQAGSTIITFDVDGSRSYSPGDVQITVVGNQLGGSIDINGNLAITASA